MQFLTVRDRRSGTESHARQMGPRGEFFAFDYEVSHDPTIESIEVQLGSDAQRSFSPEFLPDMQFGVRLGYDEARRQGMRLSSTKLFILGTREHAVDTSYAVVLRQLTEFVRSHVASWSGPILPLQKEWLTSDVVALARGIDAGAALDGIPALSDALQEAGCDDPLVMEHLRTCPDHAPSCWVVEMILDATRVRPASG